jgi:serine/threonine-protein kinase
MSTQIGHYQIVAELGRGGMGVVYKGHEAALNRYVAIKMLSPALSHDEAIKERFLREARSMAALNDPHIIQVYFIGEQDGQPFFAMEFVEGESLSAYLKREGRMTPDQAARVIFQTALGLSTAHDKGVVHRDIKPGNLMLNQRGQIKIADFGIALSQTDFSKKLTSTGEFVGTPGYLSPEVCVGQPVDLRSDIFSLGIVFFELLTGRMPFTDESPLGLLLEVVRAEIPDVRDLNAEVDADLVAVLKRMTAKDPAQRYQTCHELVADLQQLPMLTGSATLTAKPVMSTKAQTVLGMKTPLPQAVKAPTPAPLTMPTPVPSSAVAAQAAISSPSIPAQPAAHAAAAAAQRPSVLEGQNRRARANPLIAIAATVVIGALLAVAAWAMFGRQVRDGAATLAANSVSSDNNAVAALDSGNASTASEAGNTTGAAEVTSARSTDAPTSTPLGGDTGVVTGSANEVPPHLQVENVPTTSGIASADTGAGTGTDTNPEDLAPLRRMAEQIRAGQDEANLPPPLREIARNNPPPPPPPPRVVGPPRIAVLALGDPALAGPAKQLIEEALMERGFILLDTDLVQGLGGGDVARNLAAVARAGAAAVVVVRTEEIGAQQLNYYGQSSTLYSANLIVRPYDVASRAPLAAGVRAKVDFTSLNADTNTREALEPELGRLLASLGRFRGGAKG